jgi:hypothetical protein
MLDEMIPLAKPGQRSKMLAAQPSFTASLPLIKSKVSFRPFIAYLKNKQPEVSETKERLYSYLIKKFESEPSLLQDFNDADEIGKHGEIMELLTTSLFAVVGEQEKNNFALAAPYQFCVFHYSDDFRKLFFDADKQHLLLPHGLHTDQLKATYCAMIYDHVLEKFYGMKLNESPELIYPVADPQTGMMRYYRIRYDRRFIDVNLKGKLPPIQDCGICMNTFRILDLEKQLAAMPLDIFEAEGFAVWVAEDITTTEALESIKKILLRTNECGTGDFEDMKKVIKSLVGLNDVEVGLMPFIKINDQFVLDKESMGHSLVAQQWLIDDLQNMEKFRMFTGFLNEHPEPTAISNLSEEMLDFAPFMRSVFENGGRSFICYSMQNSDGLIGLLELSSTVKNTLTHEVLARLEPAIPLLSLAMLKCREGFNSKIEKVIKEKFTALQQPVEWKFAEVAWDHLRNMESGKITGNVVFENVHPLYGAIDVRNSSMERSHAIQKDLKEHLALIENLLEQLQAIVQLPLLEGLQFKNDSIRQSIETSMTAEDEVRINDFLNNEAEPVFAHLQKNNKEAAGIINEYFNTVNDSSGRLYRNRGEYEETISRINDAVLAYLEKEEETIQQSYPHYFEKYRTDGIEYNIYIGQSISPNHPFDLLYLKNIRLWQLKSMAEAARITHRLLPELKVPLQTTQLILIHSQCISISFRRDERRFDVEGSYNIRYEIIKKRLDKVRIKETNERLTQPRKIAMVYSNQKEVQEYEEYIKFLQKKNILKQGIEFLELEELQGIRGLKAMRVEVNLENE